MEKTELLSIGKIVDAHGIKGNVKVHSEAETLSILRPGKMILVRHPKGGEKTFAIQSAKPYPQGILLSLKEVKNRSQADALKGSELLIEKANLPELEKGSYYWADIIGISVFTSAGAYLGIVESIIPTGSNDVFVVRNPEKAPDKEILIPALKQIVLAIDLKQKILRVDLPEGL